MLGKPCILSLFLNSFNNAQTFPKRSYKRLVRFIKTLVSAIHIAHCMQEMIAISSDACYQILSCACILMYYLLMLCNFEIKYCLK